MTHQTAEDAAAQAAENEDSILRLFHLFSTHGTYGVTVDLNPVMGTNDTTDDVVGCMALGFRSPDFGSTARPVRYYVTDQHPEFAAIHGAWKARQ